MGSSFSDLLFGKESRCVPFVQSQGANLLTYPLMILPTSQASRIAHFFQKPRKSNRAGELLSCRWQANAPIVWLLALGGAEGHQARKEPGVSCEYYVLRFTIELGYSCWGHNPTFIRISGRH
jgi:hypothetical protein